MPDSHLMPPRLQASGASLQADSPVSGLTAVPQATSPEPGAIVEAASLVELFGAARCMHTQDMREWLEDRGVDFVEYDVDLDAAARTRLAALTGGQRLVPVLVENNAVVQIGWQGRGCSVDEVTGR